MSKKNNGHFCPDMIDNALVSLEVHYASEGTLKIRIDENTSNYMMQVWKIPPPYELSKYNGEIPKVGSVHYNLELNKNLVDRIIQAMSNIKIPAIPEYTAGIGGSTYILHINSGFNSSQYTWWDKPPKGYESLGRFVEILVEMSVKNGRMQVK